MSPTCHRLPLLRLLLVLALLLFPGCLGSDFEDAQLGIEKWDHGWLIAIEPEETFSVGLLGNNAYPESQWRVVEYDSQVLRLDGEEHEKPRAPMPDEEAAEPGQYDEGILLPSSHFGFTGLDVGETPLRFEFVVDGEPIDIAEYTIEVVDDACAAETVAVANRCGSPGFTSHPQVLHEPDHGQLVVLDAGQSIDLTLAANALFEDVPWQAVSYDSAVIAVDGPLALTPARSAADFTSELDEDASHSFLPSWQFTVTGVTAGEANLVLEIATEGRRLDAFEIAVLVE